MTSWFDAIGISATNALAGFAGGMVRVFFDRQMNPFDVVGSLVAGFWMGNYLGPLAAQYINAPGLSGGLSFAIGLGGLSLVGPIITLGRKKIFGEGGENAAKR